eukprot:g10260.t1
MAEDETNSSSSSNSCCSNSGSPQKDYLPVNRETPSPLNIPTTPIQQAGQGGSNPDPAKETERDAGTSDSTGDNYDNLSQSSIGNGLRIKKRPRDGGGVSGLKKEEQEDHMNDFLPAEAAKKKKKKEEEEEASSKDGKHGVGGGRTCVSCRKSKVKCSKGSPCKRCIRLKLECIAQVRGRGRPVASGSGLRRSAKSEVKAGANAHCGIGVDGDGSAVGAGGRDGGSYPSSGDSGSGSFLARRGHGALPPSSAGVLSSSSRSGLRAGSDGGAADGGGGGGSGGVGGGGGGPVPGPGPGGPGSADIKGTSFGFSSSAAGVAPPVTAARLSCPPPLGYNNGPDRGSIAEDVAGALGGGLGGGGSGGGVVGYAFQDFDPSSRPFPSHLLSSGRPLPSPSAAAQHLQQQHQQGAPHGSFPAARAFTQPLLHGGGGGGGGGAPSDAPPPGRMAATAPGRPTMASTAAGRGGISSGSSWRAVFHGEDVGTTDSGSKAKGSSSLSNDGGLGGFNGKDFSWAETMDEDKDPVAAAAAAAADGEEFLTRSADEKTRWLMDVEQNAGACGADSEERSPEAAEGGVDPTDTIVTGFWDLFSRQEIHRPKAVLVIRHWALCALERRSTRLMRKTVNMARALCINVAEILNDYGIYAMFHELLREAEAGNTIEPARLVKLNHQEAPPYIQELSSRFAAVSTRVVLRGQSTFFNNEMCARLFMSTEQANELYAYNKQDVWATYIHPDDHKTFFDGISLELFRVPGHRSEFTKICKCREHTGTTFLALVHFRYEFQDEGNYAAFGLSLLPLPESAYLQKVDQATTTTTLEVDREGAGVAAAVSAAGAAGCATPSSAGLLAGAGTTPATKLCDPSLAVPASSERNGVTSTSSILSVRVDAWGSHDVGGAVSPGNTGRGLDDSITPYTGSLNGGGGVEDLQDGIDGGGLGLDSGRGGLPGGWVRAPSRGEMRVADSL